MTTRGTIRPFFTVSSGVLTLAHRGARAYAPENTIPAFNKAIDICGADGVELDIHLSADKKIVVHHDDDLMRCTNIETLRLPGRKNGRYYISDYTLEEIQSLDAGSWFVREYLKMSQHIDSPESYLNLLSNEERNQYVTQEDLEFYVSGRVKIPTLDEVLKIIKDKKSRVNIEIKTLPRMYEGITEMVIEKVNRLKLTDSVLISSFDHEQLRKVRTLDKQIATAVLTSDRLAFPDHYLKALGADAYNPGCCGGCDSLGFSSVDGRLDTTAIDACRRAGYSVNVWTCNETKMMEKLLDAGVNGLITDIPNRVKEIVSHR